MRNVTRRGRMHALLTAERVVARAWRMLLRCARLGAAALLAVALGVIGGVRIPKGNGQTIKLRQGSSLADLAEKINVNPAALVTVLFHLGEMATATQSLDEATFQILGDEIGWNIKVVSGCAPATTAAATRRAIVVVLEAAGIAAAETVAARTPAVGAAALVLAVLAPLARTCSGARPRASVAGAATCTGAGFESHCSIFHHLL